MMLVFMVSAVVVMGVEAAAGAGAGAGEQEQMQKQCISSNDGSVVVYRRCYG